MNEWISFSGIPSLQLQSKGQAFPMDDQELEFYFRSSQGAWSHTTNIKFGNGMAQFCYCEYKDIIMKLNSHQLRKS